MGGSQVVGNRRLPGGSYLRDKLWQLAVSKVNEGGEGGKGRGEEVIFS